MVSTTYGYGRRLINGIIQYAQQRPDWQCLLENQTTLEALRHLTSTYALDGLIVEAREPPMLAAIDELACPVVIVTGADRMVAGPRRAQVMADNVAIGRMAFAYFRDLGFRRYAFHSLPGNRPLAVRGSSFVAAVEDAGFTCAQRWVTTPLTRHSDKRFDPGLTQWLLSLATPVALFAANDEIGVDVIRAARRIGRHVPDDIAVLGVDDDDLACSLSHPTLSSIDNGTPQIGYRAAATLDQMMCGNMRVEPITTISPPGIVKRRSTDTLVIEDEHVRKALLYVRAHACEGICVEDVISSVTVSRRKLEIAFKRQLDRTIQQEITRTQVARASELLAHTDMLTPDIAAACAFASASSLSVIFKRELGLTPTAYRKSWQEPRSG